MKATQLLPWVVFSIALAPNALAVTSAEIFTTDAYQYGRFSARVQFAPGSGVVSSFFLWKDGSEVEGTFWNELDFEKLEAECRVETNTIYGNPVGLHSERHELGADLCSSYHVYTYEWTPEYLSWLVDGVEIRRETGDVVNAYAQNTASGMQLRFNVWPGDETFGGVFNPSILPVYQYIDWIEYASYTDGDFEVLWRDDFAEASLPARWSTASWDSPKGLSTHAASNVAVKDGYVVLALTADDATGTAGASPKATDTETDPTGTTMPEPSTSVSEPPATTSVAGETSTESESTTTQASGTANTDSREPEPTDVDTQASTDSSRSETAAQTSSSEQASASTTLNGPSTSQTTSANTNTTAPSPSTSELDPSSDTSSTTTAGDASTVGTGCACRLATKRSPNNDLVVLGLALVVALGWRRLPARDK